MKNNRRNWIVVVIVVIATIANVLGSLRGSNSQESSELTIQAQKTPPQHRGWERFEGLFPVVDYHALESNKPVDQDERRIKSKRYDKYEIVPSNPNPNTAASEIVDESFSISSIPVKESNLIIIGEVLNAQAYLSNNKTGIYSEFTIRVGKVLKNDISKEISENEKISLDRFGGFVRFPNGQKVFYGISGRRMPRVGVQHIFFLTKPDQSTNYEILTAYELKDGKVYPIDSTYIYKTNEGRGIEEFMKALNEAMNRPAQQNEQQKEGL